MSLDMWRAATAKAARYVESSNVKRGNPGMKIGYGYTYGNRVQVYYSFEIRNLTQDAHSRSAEGRGPFELVQSHSQPMACSCRFPPAVALRPVAIEGSVPDPTISEGSVPGPSCPKKPTPCRTPRLSMPRAGLHRASRRYRGSRPAVPSSIRSVARVLLSRLTTTSGVASPC